MKAGWSEAQIEHIEQDHRDILYASRSEALFKELLVKCSNTSTSFDEGWGLCQGWFDSLRQFAGGLASIFSNTASVESDLSLIGVEKTVYRQSLTDFSLEGILHAKKFESLRAMSAE